MKMLTGAILLLIAELAFAHAHLIQFPHHLYVREFLIPASLVSLTLGGLFLIWGCVTEVVQKRPAQSTQQDESASANLK